MIIDHLSITNIFHAMDKQRPFEERHEFSVCWMSFET